MQNISRRSFIATALFSAAFLGACSGGSQTTTATSDAGAESGSQDTSQPSASQDGAASAGGVTGIHHAKIEVEGYGTIEVALNADVAPITVENFMTLAESGFYDGLTFHRIMDGFMIQGGDPLGNGTGGSSQNIVGEFSANGYENNLTHVRGVISMARSNDFNSASSQFFIVQTTSHFLDGQYAAFGTVTSGMEFVDAICKDTPVEDDNGTVLPENQPRITKIEILD